MIMEISMIPDSVLDDLASRGMTTEQIEKSNGWIRVHVKSLIDQLLPCVKLADNKCAGKNSGDEQSIFSRFKLIASKTITSPLNTRARQH